MKVPSVEVGIMHQSRQTHLLRRWNGLTLWEQWLTATVTSEMIGLAIIVIISTLSRNLQVNPYGLLALLGAIEGIVLGLSQWIVLRRYIRHAGWWILATLVGAMIAWFSGLFVSTVLAITIAASPPTQQVSILLKGIIIQGTGVGVILGYAQWLVLQSHIRHQIWRKAVRWLFANVAAWVLALLIAFIGVGELKSVSPLSLKTAMVAATTGGTMGAIVGIITGIALVSVLKPRSA
jgi:hypothetical protein